MFNMLNHTSNSKALGEQCLMGFTVCHLTWNWKQQLIYSTIKTRGSRKHESLTFHKLNFHNYLSYAKFVYTYNILQFTISQNLWLTDPKNEWGPPKGQFPKKMISFCQAVQRRRFFHDLINQRPWWPSWMREKLKRYNFERGTPKEYSHELWIHSVKPFSGRRLFKIGPIRGHGDHGQQKNCNKITLKGDHLRNIPMKYMFPFIKPFPRRFKTNKNDQAEANGNHLGLWQD